MPAAPGMSRIVAVLARAPAFVLLALVVLAAGQPLVTDDLWWHLALGDAYASAGPWLAEDPLLFTAEAAPAPASWLADLALAKLVDTTGFQGLRVLHVALAAAILGLVRSTLRRAGAGPAAASLATAVFAALAAYRLVQLRPHLLSVLATLLLYRIVLAGRTPLTPLRVLAAVALMALWANLHGGFLLGPVLVAAVSLAWGVEAAFAAGEARVRLRRDALAAAVTAVLGGLATGLRPSGFSRHADLFAVAGATPALDIVVDEWARLDPFQWPVAALPPSPLVWLLFWGLALATVTLAFGALRARVAGRVRPEDSGSFGRIVLALGSLAAMLAAVRFSWMGVFPLLAVAGAFRPRAAATGGRVALGLVGAVALVAFVRIGDWPMISRGIQLRSFPASYAPAYPPGKYHAHAVWFLADAGLEGRLFHDYVGGGFLGYWLAPEIRGFVNGTLNVPPEILDALEAVRAGRGLQPGEDLSGLLDRYRVDLFFGIGTPRLPRPGRPQQYSTTLLEGVPGWLPVFRNQSSAVYLRRAPRNRDALERVAAYYAREGIPFDREQGFSPAAAIDASLVWSVRNAVVPVAFRELQAASRARAPAARADARDRLAQAYAQLGLYEHALRLDRRLLREQARHARARRRVVWSLLRLGRFAEARSEARFLVAGELESLLAASAEALFADPTDAEARSVLARLPLLSRSEAAGLGGGLAEAPVRSPR